MKKKKLDLSITSLRLTVVVVGLALVFLNEFFIWGISNMSFVFALAVGASVFLTQPKKKS